MRPSTRRRRRTSGDHSIVQTLIDKGYAYVAGGDVYYRTAKFPDYGKLSHQPLEDLQAGARIDVTDVKEIPWILRSGRREAGGAVWTRHGEKTARLAHRVLGHVGPLPGKTLTFTGGAGLTFPHHENEIASRRRPTVQIRQYWLHNGFNSIDNRKMSKSLGNFFTVRDPPAPTAMRTSACSCHEPLQKPAQLLGGHLIQAQSALERLKTAEGNLKFSDGTRRGGQTDGRRGFILDGLSYTVTFYRGDGRRLHHGGRRCGDF
jgi:cysteinyl-tRNA synthetase